MSDQNPPDNPQQPGYPPPQGFQPQQGYPPPPGNQQQPYQSQSGDYPGKTLGIVGLVLSFFTALIGLIISIVALRQSKKAGFKNTPALIGIIVGIVSTIIVVIFVTVAIIGAVIVLQQCAQLGPGVHEISGVRVTCG